MTSSESREDSIYFARLSEQGERYEDMIKYMQIVAKVSHTFNYLPLLVPYWTVKWREKSFECGL
jgi:hypothetical protein